MINGQQVWKACDKKNDSSNDGIIPSAQSEFISHSFVDNPSPGMQSWPPPTSPSQLTTRLTSGIPVTRFGGGYSQASSPASGISTNDPFREAMNKQRTSGPRSSSPFQDTYNEYKDLDTAAKDAELRYKEYIATAEKVSKKKREGRPGHYAGAPLESKEFHRKAAEICHRGAQAFKA